MDKDVTAEKASEFTPRLLGLLTGVAVAILIVVGARPASPTEAVSPNLNLRILAALSGEIGAVPAAPKAFAEDRDLRVGQIATGTVRMTNQTAGPVVLSLVADPSAPGLEEALRLKLTSGESVLADSTLGALRDGTPKALRIPPGQTRPVRVRAWLSGEATDAYTARSVSVILEPAIRGSR